MKCLFTLSMTHIEIAFGLLPLCDRSFSSWLEMLKTTDGSTYSHTPSHTLQSLLKKLFSQISARWGIRRQKWVENPNVHMLCSFPLFIPSSPYFLASPSLFSPPHPTLSRVLQIALPSIFLTSFFLSSLLPHSIPFNSAPIFVSLFSMHCHSLVNFWILPFGSSFSLNLILAFMVPWSP